MRSKTDLHPGCSWELDEVYHVGRMKEEAKESNSGLLQTEIAQSGQSWRISQVTVNQLVW